jgi:hypothetical protein
MSIKKVFKIISWEIYPFDLLFCYNCSDKNIRDYVEKNFYKLTKREEKNLTFSNMVGGTVMLEGGQTILWIKNKHDLGVLAHEVYHAVCFLMDRIDVQLSESSEEAFAYAIEFMMNKIKKII